MRTKGDPLPYSREPGDRSVVVRTGAGAIASQTFEAGTDDQVLWDFVAALDSQIQGPAVWSVNVEGE